MMQKSLGKILGTYFSATQIGTRAESLISKSTKSELRSAQNQLSKIRDRFADVEDQEPEISQETIRRFHKAIADGKSGLEKAFDTNREKRKLSHALGVSLLEENIPAIVDGPNFEAAVRFLFRHWRHSFLGPLLRLLLGRWCDLAADRRKYLSYLLQTKIEDYDGKRALYLGAKKNTQFLFDKSGALRFGAECYKGGASPKIFYDGLGLPATWARLSYFDEVMLGYVVEFAREKRTVAQLDTVVKALEARISLNQSGRDEITLKCFVRLLLWAERYDDGTVRKILSESVVRHVGDPIDDVKWAPWANASAEDKKEITRARRFLSAIIAAHFIELFFERIAQDKRRSAFWKDYYKSIPYIKVFCPEDEARKIFKRHPELNETYADRVGTMSGTKDTAALVMEVGDHFLVEFSKSGNAFYAYRMGDSKADDGSGSLIYGGGVDSLARKLKEKHINLNTLKQTHLVPKVSKNNWKDKVQGRVYHVGDWETVLRRWLAFHLSI